MAISLSLQRPQCNPSSYETIKNAVVIPNHSCKSSLFIQQWGNLLCQRAWKTMETVDWHPLKLRLNREEKTLQGRVFVVTTVRCEVVLHFINWDINDLTFNYSSPMCHGCVYMGSYVLDCHALDLQHFMSIQ